jgi:hypothetical protein
MSTVTGWRKRTIMEMAREANLPACHTTHPKALERFAALVREDEREECAKLCEQPGWNAANWCAKAIRARGEQA